MSCLLKQLYMKCALGSVLCCSLYCRRKTNVIEIILQDWDERYDTEFQLLQSWKTQGLGFDLVFVSGTSRIEYMNYAEDNLI